MPILGISQDPVQGPKLIMRAVQPTGAPVLEERATPTIAAMRQPMQRGIFGRRPAQPSEADWRGASFSPDMIAGQGQQLQDVPLLRDPGALGQDARMPAIATPKIKLKFFDSNGPWRDVASTLLTSVGDAFLAQSPGGAQLLQNRRAQQDQQNRMAYLSQVQNLKLQQMAAERAKPQYFSGSEDRLMYDPTTGQTTTLFDAPNDAQDYAAGFGFQPGSEDYADAMSDFVLRDYGPTASDAKTELEGQRQRNRLSYEGSRQANRVRLEGVRQGNRKEMRTIPTYGQANPKPSGSRSSARSAVAVGTTASNPATGQKVRWNGSAWTPVR